jgi:REP element-mobilizing transposase RayT
LSGLFGDQTIGKTIQMIKGESSFWINKNQLIMPKFEWQDEYFALSVSQSMLDRVRNYIRDQEEHHSRHPYKHEFGEIIHRYAFEKL